MYKVFVDDCPIILTDNNNISTKFEIIKFQDIHLFEVVHLIWNHKVDGIYLLCDNLERCWQIFQSKFKIQKAAGGKVVNLKNEVLFIYRFNKWDLPKGKLEKGESIEECAIREVEEECGVKQLKIKNQLQTTYHIFERKGIIILKITYWFLMDTTFIGNLIPQTEEGIEQVCFKDDEESIEALKNTYENIRLLFE